MRFFGAVPVFTAIASLAFGVALYYVFLPATPVPGTVEARLQSGQAQSEPAAGEFPENNSFSFNAYPEPRDVPELAFVSGDGRPLKLDDFRGKFVLLNVWATWCGPCREEMPALDRLQAKLGGPGFMVLPLSIDQEGPGVVKDFYEELGLTSLGIYVDETLRAPVTLSVIGIPATLFINPQGREIGRVLGPAEWDSPEVIEELKRYTDQPI